MKIINKNLREVKAQFFRNYLYCLIPLGGWLIGWRLDYLEDERMARFRDKTALYKRDVPPEKPSW